MLTNPSEGEVFAPVAMWLEAIDLVLQRLKDQGADFSKIMGVSGAGMQHGTVFWSKDAEGLLSELDAGKTLLEQLDGGTKGERKGAFSHPFSPNWQDASTQKQCEAFDKKLGDPESLAEETGSKAHHVRWSDLQLPSNILLMAIHSASAVLKSSASTKSILMHTRLPPASPSCHPFSHPYSSAKSRQ